MHLYKCSHTPQVGFGPNLGYRDSFPKKIIVSQKLYGASKNSLTFSIFPHSSKNPHKFHFLENPKISCKIEIYGNFGNLEKFRKNTKCSKFQQQKMQSTFCKQHQLLIVQPCLWCAHLNSRFMQSKSAKQSPLCIGLPVPNAAAQTVNRVFVLACAAWLVCRHNAGWALHESP